MLRFLGRCAVVLCCIPLMLAGISTAQAQKIVLNFDDLPGTDFNSGSAISGASQLADTYLNTLGVRFSSSAGYVGVVDLGPGHAVSGINGISASTSNGLVSYSDADPITISFFDPAHPTVKAVTDFVSIRGDLAGNGAPLYVTLEAFDINGNRIGIVSKLDSGGETFTFSIPGIHAVRFNGVPNGFGGVALDDVMFHPVTVPAQNIRLQNSASGAVYNWALSGTTIAAQSYIWTGGDASWNVAANPDLNSDGQSDIVIQNAATGAVYYWQLNNGAIGPTLFLWTGGDAQWKVVGMPDLNGDGNPDVILQNSATGAVYYWLLNGPAISSTGYLWAGGDTNWKALPQ